MQTKYVRREEGNLIENEEKMTTIFPEERNEITKQEEQSQEKKDINTKDNVTEVKFPQSIECES